MALDCCLGGKYNGFHPIEQAFYSRIANADIRGRRIANPPELDIVFCCFSFFHKLPDG